MKIPFVRAFALFLLVTASVLHAQVPQLVNYQGRVAVGSPAVNFNGSGQFKFALVDGTGSTAYWSNDGSITGPITGASQPAAAVTLTVTNGLYSVLLGDTSLGASMTTIPASVWANADVRLCVWFNDGTNGFQLLTPDQRLAPNGYLPDGSVSSAKIATGAVGNSQLGSNLTLSGTTTGAFTGSGTTTYQTVAGTAQNAAPNTNYLLTNSALSVVTLPPTPALGDVVRINGVGAGGWQAAPNSGQSIVGAGSTVGPAGAAWTARESARTWTSVASSADGTKLVAAVRFGQLYTSTDSGATWTARDSSRVWESVASSTDGTKLAAAADNSDFLYTSTDSGVTWTARDSARNWLSVASSSDGSKLVAAVDSGQLYTSTDSGVTWTARDSSRFWSSVASSSDGSKLVAAVTIGQLYTSTDSGVTWTARDSSRDWVSVASSADGIKLVASDGSPGHLYTSTDSGVTWTARDSTRSWAGVASSADGTRLVATLGGGGLTYTSTDSGVSWMAQFLNLASSVASSADGTKLVAAVYNGQLYTSVGATIANPLAGAPGTTVGLQYIGNNQWQALTEATAASANSVAAANITGTLTGTQIASGAVGSAQLASGAVGSIQLAPGLTLGGTTTFSGNIALPATSSSTVGVITQNGLPLIQTFGFQNFFAGGAGNFTMTGGQNTALGVSELLYNTTGNGNTASGWATLSANTTGNENTASGIAALTSNTAGSENTAIGNASLQLNTSGNYNTAIGSRTLSTNSTGGGNTASGFFALFFNTTGGNNTANGGGALQNNTTGSNNVAIGSNAGSVLTTGSNNIDIGHQGVAGESNIIRIGDGTSQTDTYLTGIIHGNGSGLTGLTAASLTAGSITNVLIANGAVGSTQLASGLTLGGTTVISGNLDIPATTSGTVGNITQGGQVLLQTYGAANFFAGVAAGNFTTTGNSNTATGKLALSGNTSGSSNSAVGYTALENNTSGSDNSAVGAGTLRGNTSGNNNSAFGYNALASNTQGSNNTVSGFQTLLNNTTADQNVALGAAALFSQSYSNGNTEWPSNNVAVGYQSLYANAPTSTSNGNSNTAVGTLALSSNTTGSNNIALGNQAGTALTTGSNNIDIGNPGVAAEGGVIRIGTQGTQTATFIAGIFGNTITQAMVGVNSSGQLGVLTSSRRFKRDIADMDKASETLLSLRPVSFRYKPELDAQGTPQFGLIAEEVNEVNPDLVVRDDKGEIYTVRYEAVNAMLLNEFLKDHHRAETRDAEIAKLRNENAAMKQRLAEFEAKDQEHEARISRLENLLPPATLPTAVKTAANLNGK